MPSQGSHLARISASCVETCLVDCYCLELHSWRYLYRDRVATKRRDPPAMTVQDVLDDIRKRPGTGEVIPIIDPATEEQLTEFTDCGPEAINDAVARAKVLGRVADLIDENAEILTELESLNAGIPPAQAQIITKVGSEWFRYYAGWCTKIDGIARDVNTGGLTGGDSHMHTYTLREPYGVVGLIFPWNGPVFNYCAKLAPSLAAGCSSVVK